ncbi:MAG: hypothetical protein AAF604_10270 [Acidobacteriota bacterium]
MNAKLKTLSVSAPTGLALALLVLLGSWGTNAEARPLTNSCSVFCAAEADACYSFLDQGHAQTVAGCHTGYQGCIDNNFPQSDCEMVREQCLTDAQDSFEGGELFCEAVLEICEEEQCGNDSDGAGNGGGDARDRIDVC